MAYHIGRADPHAVRFGLPCTLNGYGVRITYNNWTSKCHVNGETVNTPGTFRHIGVFGNFKATLCSSPDGKNPIKTIDAFPKNWSLPDEVDLNATEPKITPDVVKSIIIIGSRPEFPAAAAPPPPKEEKKVEQPSNEIPYGLIIGIPVSAGLIALGTYAYMFWGKSENSSGGYYRSKYR